MSSRFLNYTMTLETVGPLFVGSGKTIGKNEYVIRDNKLCILDMKKMFLGLSKFHLEKKYADGVLSDKGFSLGYFFRENRILPDNYNKWIKYTLDIPENTDLRKTNILPIIKDPYCCPYIPGSSIKGAIRNAILNAVMLSGENAKYGGQIERNIYRHKDRNGKYISKTRYLKLDSDNLDTVLFNTLGRLKNEPENAVNSIFQGLKISDSSPLDTGCLILCPKIDVFPDNDGENKLKNAVRECVKPGTGIAFSVRIDTAIFPFDAEKILRCIDTTFNNIKMNFLSPFANVVSSSDGHNIFVGGGAGFVSKTCVYSLFEERDRTVENAGEILNHVDSFKPKSKEKMGNHKKDFEYYNVSPHVRKCTRINNRVYDMGLCAMDFKLL